MQQIQAATNRSKLMNWELTPKQFTVLEFCIIFCFAIFPLFFQLPYRVNIFLSWEGAYRLYQGQIPYKDFGLPMGFVYWVIPAVFFKIFGPYLFTLVKAQVFINIISGITFRSILKTFSLLPASRLLSVLVFCLSYSFFNFWPWYNHTVFVYELLGINFILLCIFTSSHKKKWVFLFLGALFVVLSFFTKQDGGGLAIVLCFALLLYPAILEKETKYVLFYWIFIAITSLPFVLPFLQHDFLYWFNYGQLPHFSRISAIDIINATFGGSMWEKFYLCLVIIIVFSSHKNLKSFFFNKEKMIFTLFTLGILCQALIIQVTSYTPPDNNIYFHSFAFAFFISYLSQNIRFEKVYMLLIASFMIFFWWSGVYYQYVQRIIKRYFPATLTENPERHIISKNTYVVTDTSNMRIDMAKWKLSDMRAFRNIYMPESTVEGLKYIMEMKVFTSQKSPKVLNMTELTPLADELEFELEINQPLWYHFGVSIFQKEVDEYCRKIQQKHYDVVLFEVIPTLNNFYPDEIRECLRENYQLQHTFLAPRRLTNATIEIYVKARSENNQ